MSWADVRSRRIRFHSFGDINTASSRLRAWYLAHELRQVGHSAAVNAGSGADIEVFQKVRPFSNVAAAARAGRKIVYDFDDNYLLASVGTHDSVVAIMNAADLVTVGSRVLHEAASRYHDNVYLFENPLDVRPGSEPREPREWGGRLGWFGNPTNLTALEALELPYGVRTITSHGGDIRWDVETVDEHVQGFDLVLIPVRPTEWTLSKNANRMLKSLALGVPCLVSDVPEHRAVVERSGLPDWVLVPAGADWTERIERAREEHVPLQTAVQVAARWAVNQYGLTATTRRWLERVAPLVSRLEEDDAPPLAVGPAPGGPRLITARPMAGLDVVIWCENEPQRALATIESLAAPAALLRSVTVVSAQALPEDVAVPDGYALVAGLEDFFDVYTALRDAIAAAAGRRVLLLKAGVEVRPGLFHHLAATEDLERVELFTAQESTAPFGVTEPPAATMQATLVEPGAPAAMAVPIADVRRALPAAGAGPLVLWDFLIRLHAAGAHVETITEPLVLIDRVVAARHPIQSYSVFLSATRPELVGELPGLEDEWERLSHTLTSAILESHRELLARFGPPLVAELMFQRSKLRRATRTADARPPARRAARSAPRPADEPVLVPAPSTELALVPVEGEHTGLIRHPVRLAWRTVRPLFPKNLRTRLYKRYRASYERFFPERALR
jgi:hypothetical protein